MVGAAVSAGLNAFLSQAPEGAKQALCLLAQAESLTDATAERLYDLSPVGSVSASAFIRALHYTDLVRPRNSEWHFAPAVRADLLAETAQAKSVTAAHELLLSIARTGDRAEARTRIPSYLFTAAGEAYHLAELGGVEDALPLYSASAMEPLSGRQWLAARLATEQESRSVIPAGTVEITFLKAMYLYRLGDKAAAKPLFEQLARDSSDRIEIAIACHLLANMIARDDAPEAERLYTRSIDIGRRAGNDGHVAQALNSLANHYSRDPSRAGAAERLYREAIGIEEARGYPRGVARTSHSLANLLSRIRPPEAEELYRRALRIGEALGDDHDVAQVLHGLANHLSRDPDRAEEAEALYRRSLAIEEDKHGIAQKLHSFGNLLSRDPARAEEAEELYRRSLSIGSSNQNHVAQTLRSLAALVEGRSVTEALDLLNRSLKINQTINNRNGVEIVLRSLDALRRRHKLD